MKEMGISAKIRKERYISFHSWRHFFNTTMRSNNIADSKVQRITGHKSEDMTENYTHFRKEDFEDVRKLQENIIPFAKEEENCVETPNRKVSSGQ